LRPLPRLELDRKYAGIANLLLVYVWDLEDMDETRTYALTYPEALAIVEDRRHTGTASWKRGRYSVGAPGAKLVELLQPFLMSPGGWREKVLSATGQRQRKTA
jgi:hypothetical protein